jgi:hypothetical protein
MKNVEVREENADRAQPERLSWDDFTARGEDLDDPRTDIQPPPPKRPEAKESPLSALLLEAIHAAGARRGRLSRPERIREQTLLEVLSETMRRAR